MSRPGSRPSAGWGSRRTSRRTPANGAVRLTAGHTPSRLRAQPTLSQEGGAALRLDEDRWAVAQAAAPRRTQGRLDRVLHRSGVQPRALAHARRAAVVTTRECGCQLLVISNRQPPYVNRRIGAYTAFFSTLL